MPAKLTKAEQKRLAKLIGHVGVQLPGERANAEAQATQLLQKVGLTLEEYLASQKQVAVAQAAVQDAMDSQARANWKAMVKVCLLEHDRKADPLGAASVRQMGRPRAASQRKAVGHRATYPREGDDGYGRGEKAANWDWED